MRLRGSFEEVAHQRFVGVEADARVLQIDDYGVELAQVGLPGMLIGRFRAVESEYGQVCSGILLGRLVLGILLAVEAVLGREERGQFDPGASVKQEVYRAAALRVEAGLIGEEADAEMASVLLCQLLEGGKVRGFEDIDAGQGGGLVRSRQGRARSTLSISSRGFGGEPQSVRGRSGNLAP